MFNSFEYYFYEWIVTHLFSIIVIEGKHTFYLLLNKTFLDRWLKLLLSKKILFG